MAYPTAPTDPIVEIATDTNYSAPSEAWDATAIKVSPAAGVLTQGFAPGDLRVPMYDNWLFSTFARWLTYLNDYCIELKAQKVQGPASSTDNAVARFDSTTGKIVQNSALIVADTTGEATYTTPISRTVVFGLDRANPTFGTWAFGEAGAVVCSSIAGTINVPISDWLPDGASLASVHVLLDPGIARATTGNRVQFELVSRTRTVTVGTESLGSRSSEVATYDDGTTNLQAVPVLTGGAIAVSKSTGKLTFLIVTSGNNADVNNDTVYAVKLTYTDPGPSAR